MYVRRAGNLMMTKAAFVKAAGAHILAATALMAGVLAGGCGSADEPRAAATTRAAGATAAARTTTAQDEAPGTARHAPIPRALRAAESDAEDTIDLALAGRRSRVLTKARALKAVADGPARPALRAAGVTDTEIAEFRARADEVALLAPRAPLLQVAIASNRAFALIAAFFAHYDSPIPPQVSTLDNLDFEAKLRAKAGDTGALRSAVSGLGVTWAKLRPQVVAAGGGRVAARFDAHVERMGRLAAIGGAGAAREAQRGLDLVDELEAVYRR
jgi:hypothetical protein